MLIASLLGPIIDFEIVLELDCLSSLRKMSRSVVSSGV